MGTHPVSAHRATESAPSSNRGFTIWITGLSGAGKTTLANLLLAKLLERGIQTELLDGDTVRLSLSRNLGYSRADRDENIARLAFIAHLLTRNGVAVIVAAISPYRAARDSARALIGHFLEVYVSCPLDVLVARDPKGLYRRALQGELPHFTGISDPYEPPQDPEVEVNSSRDSPEEGLMRIWDALAARHLVTRE